MGMLGTVESVVKAVGGRAAAADLAGVGADAVSMWKARGRIPAEHWFVFSGELRRLGKIEADPSLFGFNQAAEARA